MSQSTEIHALNTVLWRLVQQAAQRNPLDAGERFGLPTPDLDVIAHANDGQLVRLVSGAIVFFTFRQNEVRVLEELKVFSRNEETCAFHPEAEFAQLWWLSLSKMATIDPLKSAHVFGVSTELAKQIASVPIPHIRQFSIVSQMSFGLRFEPKQIQTLLSSPVMPAQLFLKIHQQALSGAVVSGGRLAEIPTHPAIKPRMPLLDSESP